MTEKFEDAVGMDQWTNTPNFSEDRADILSQLTPPRDQPPLMSEPRTSFFQASRNVTIAGGQFNSTMGHHTNLTINLSQSLPSNIGSTVPETSTVVQDHARTSSSSDENGSNIDRGVEVDNNVNKEQIDLISKRSLQPPLPTAKSNEIYERNLCLKKRGFPLWIPEPNRRLPLAYRKCGVSIGDVGIITPAGGFSFLFNICLPADDPINLGRVPEGFSPIHPPINISMDVSEFSEFKRGSYLASASIEKSHNNNASSPDLFFETTASEGAILTMPEGAVSLDFENLPHFRAYAAANVESWYRFVNGPRGREAKNGDIRLVTGCDKTTSWGMAALANVSQEQTNSLRFKTLDNPHNTASACAYAWDCSGMAEARVGPDLGESIDLGNDEHSAANMENAGNRKYENQCLFVRTLNLTLGHAMWEKINRELALEYGVDHTSYIESNDAQIGEAASSRNTPNMTKDADPLSYPSPGGFTRLSPQSLDEEGSMRLLRYYGDTGPFRFQNLERFPHSARSYFVAESSNVTNSAFAAIEKVHNHSSDSSDLGGTSHVLSESMHGSDPVRAYKTLTTEKDLHRMLITTTPDNLAFHPSNSLNKFILEKNPTARLIITHDDDWSLTVSENEIAPEQLEEQLVKKVIERHDFLYEWDGSVSLISNKESLASEVRELPLISSPNKKRKRTHSSDNPCARCISAAKKCDGSAPCNRCTKYGIQALCTRPNLRKITKVSQSQDQNKSSKSQRNRSPNSRAIRACNFCIAKKIRCDASRPQCSGCKRRHLDCSYSALSGEAAARTSRSPSAQPARRCSSPAIV